MSGLPRSDISFSAPLQAARCDETASHRNVSHYFRNPWKCNAAVCQRQRLWTALKKLAATLTQLRFSPVNYGSKFSKTILVTSRCKWCCQSSGSLTNPFFILWPTSQQVDGRNKNELWLDWASFKNLLGKLALMDFHKLYSSMVGFSPTN